MITNLLNYLLKFISLTFIFNLFLNLFNDFKDITKRMSFWFFLFFFLFIIKIGLGFFFSFLFIYFYLSKKNEIVESGSIKKELIKNWIIKNLLEVKSSSFIFEYIIISLFMAILIFNYFGLLVLLPQNFLRKFSLRLLIIALRIWIITYVPIIKIRKEKLSLFVIGEIKFPPLSLLLSNIEILTHLFRPVTLTARLWVNIWVGHLILRGLSFFFCFSFFHISKIRILKSFLRESFFFVFERLIIFLQTFVFTYLIKVYFEENEHHAKIKI